MSRLLAEVLREGRGGPERVPRVPLTCPGAGGAPDSRCGCCGLKLKKSAESRWSVRAWQHRKWKAQEKPRGAQRGPKRVTRREVGLGKVKKKNVQ